MSAPLVHKFSIALVGAVVIAAALVGTGSTAVAQDTGWTITSFDARYAVNVDGTVAAAEDIVVDFGPLERHGIIRDIPIEYAFDEDHNRLISVTAVWVDDGEQAVPFETSREGPKLRIKIGDPDVLVSGEQRYRISYTINDGLNPFSDHDELYWNVTGNEWPVTIESASARVELPGRAMQASDCFEGPTGSTDRCTTSASDRVAVFQTDGPLVAGSGMTLVVAIDKGLVSVGPPVLVDANRDPFEQAADFLSLDAPVIAAAAVMFLLFLSGLVYLWWMVGRDRWFGDRYYFTDDPPTAEIKPLYSNETVVVEYEPPPVGPEGRRLRPAEVGLVLDERADTLDVSATIVDLAVRKFLRIEELGDDEYELVQLESPEGYALLPYEERLLRALFRDDDRVRLDDLKNEFHEDLAEVKTALYNQGVQVDRFFPTDPEKTRLYYALVGAGVAAAGGVLVWFLGTRLELGMLGVPLAAAGGLLLVGSGAMPRRTARGRQAYRRCLGFRTFITAGDHGEYRFAEEAHIFEEYLPYAIVFGSAKKWAEQFEALGIEPQVSGWYVGTRPFQPVAFATGIRSFSNSVGGVLASTPGGSGGSGFSGGGFSGGGGGGGGGGSW